ncbi:hypothetical protein [Baekduia soli]|uniref:hypothetical protein n=1 Tax=Baekduia soli TaxID=496014 RepID=UPI001652306B|nr:hypothetical protein [Baekduia soli]
MQGVRAIDPDVRPEYPDLARVGTSLRRWWPAALVVAILFAALGAHASKPAATPYAASAQVLVGPLAGELSVLRASGQQAQTYADLATSRPVFAAVLKQLRSTESVSAFGRRVTVAADSNTRLLKVTVQARTPAAAAGQANALAAEVVRESAAQQPAVTALTKTKSGQINPRQAAAAVRLRIVESAVPPPATKSGSKKSFMAVAALAGALLAFMLGLVSDSVRRRIETVGELDAVCPAPTIGRLRDGHLSAATVTLSGARGGVVVGEVSGGGAQLSLALGRALASEGVRVLLADADPDGGLSTLLGAGDAAGLLDTGESPARPIPVDRAGFLQLLARGAPGHRATRRPDPARALAAAAPGADTVIVNAGAAPATGEFVRGLGSDTAVLAVPQGRVRAADVAEAVAILERQGLRVVGAVFVQRPGLREALQARRRRAGRRPAPPASPAPAGTPDHQPA